MFGVILNFFSPGSFFVQILLTNGLICIINVILSLWALRPIGPGGFGLRDYSLFEIFEMKKVIFFIDGFNLYHAIANKTYRQYKWLNLNRLAYHFINKSEKIENIYYFTALTQWNPHKVKRHKIYIKALESEGVKTVYGQFKKKTKKCRICHQMFETFEEKQTDVNIAIYLFKLAIENKYDRAFLISGDSDLIPAISAIKASFPQKEISVIIPIRGRAFELKNACDSHVQMKEKHLKMNQFPREIRLPDGSKINCPSTWLGK